MGAIIGEFQGVASLVKRFIELKAFTTDSAVTIDEFLKGSRTSKNYLEEIYIKKQELVRRTKEGLIFIDKNKVKKHALHSIYVTTGVTVLIALIFSLLMFFARDPSTISLGILVIIFAASLNVALLTWFPTRVLRLLRNVSS